MTEQLAELVARLHEGSSVYARRGSAASGRLRAQTFAAFAVVGLPSDAVPYVVEALRTELNPEVVAGAARATRGWIGADPDLADALLQGLRNLRGRDAPVDLGAPSTALCEVLAALRVQPSVERGLLEGLRKLQAEGAAAWEARVRQAFTETIEVLQRRVGIGTFRLEGPGPAIPEPVEDPAPGELRGVVVEDQDGIRLDLADYLGRAPTVVAFFYTRCANPYKCSLTVTKLADLQQRLDELGVVDRQLAAIQLRPGFMTVRPGWRRTAGPAGCALTTAPGCSAPSKGTTGYGPGSACGSATTARSSTSTASSCTWWTRGCRLRRPGLGSREVEDVAKVLVADRR